MLTDYPLVSIIVLVYNNSDKLNETLKSVLDQKYPNIELIISDDCSLNIDFTEVQGYVNTHRNINIVDVKLNINLQNFGTVKNANIALSKTSGRFIKFISPGDCFYSENSLHILVDAIINTKALVVVGQSIVSTEASKYCKLAMKNIERLDGLSSGELKKLLMEENVINTVGSLFCRSIFGIYNLFDEQYFLLEDWPTWIILCKNNVKIKFLNTITNVYSLGGISNSCKNSRIANKLDEDILMLYRKEVLPVVGSYGRIGRYKALFLYRRIMSKRSKNKTDKILFLLKYALYIIIKRVPVRIRNSMVYFGRNNVK